MKKHLQYFIADVIRSLPVFGRLFRDPAGARTQDPILKRDVLYLLSY